MDLEAPTKRSLYTEADFPNLKIALVHYWLVTWRGGERVIRSMLDLFPQADIYTLFYDANICGRYLTGHKVYTSSWNIPILRNRYQKLFSFYPQAIKSLKLKRDYDLLISSESGPAKGISYPRSIPHLCYVHSPMRYCWGFTDEYVNSLPRWSHRLVRKQFNKLRDWDYGTIDNVDTYLANSHNVSKRISKYYGKSSDVIWPPVSLDLFTSPLETTEKKHYLSFGAITPYKKVDLLIKAFNQSGEPLVIIGDGSEREKLQRLANTNIRFTGTLPWAEISRLITQSRALLFPGEEDFGLIPLEVMAYGVPVIAYQKGGALETVVENIKTPEYSSGLFFSEQTVEALQSTITEFEHIEHRFDSKWIRQHARGFGDDHFKEKFSKAVLNLLNQRIIERPKC